MTTTLKLVEDGVDQIDFVASSSVYALRSDGLTLGIPEVVRAVGGTPMLGEGQRILDRRYGNRDIDIIFNIKATDHDALVGSMRIINRLIDRALQNAREGLGKKITLHYKLDDADDEIVFDVLDGAFTPGQLADPTVRRGSHLRDSRLTLVCEPYGRLARPVRMQNLLDNGSFELPKRGTSLTAYYAIDLDSQTTKYLSRANCTGLTGTPLAVGLWVDWDAQQGASVFLMQAGDNGTNERSYRLWIDSDNKVNFIWTDTQLVDNTITATNALTAGKHFIGACIYKGSIDSLTAVLMVDEDVVGSVTTTGPPVMQSPTGGFYIGQGSAASDHFEGEISQPFVIVGGKGIMPFQLDYIRRWGTKGIWSTDENLPDKNYWGLEKADLGGIWTMYSIGSDEVEDESGNDRHLTVNGSPSWIELHDLPAVWTPRLGWDIKGTLGAGLSSTAKYGCRGLRLKGDGGAGDFHSLQHFDSTAAGTPKQLLDNDGFIGSSLGNPFFVTSDGKMASFFMGWTAAAGIYYRISLNGGATWGARHTILSGGTISDYDVAGVQVGDTYYGVAEDYNGGVSPTLVPFKLVYDPADGTFTYTGGTPHAKTSVAQPQIQVVWDSVNSYFHVLDKEDGTPTVALYAFDTSLAYKYTWSSPKTGAGYGVVLSDGASIYVLTKFDTPEAFDFRVATAGASSYSVSSAETGLPSCPAGPQRFVMLWGVDGKVEVVYNKEGIDIVQYIVRSGVSSWSAPATVNTDWPSNSFPYSFAYYDKTGSPLRGIVFADGDEYYIRTATGWIADTLATTGARYVPSAVILSDDKVRGYEWFASPVSLKYVEYEPWSAEPIGIHTLIFWVYSDDPALAHFDVRFGHTDERTHVGADGAGGWQQFIWTKALDNIFTDVDLADNGVLLGWAGFGGVDVTFDGVEVIPGAPFGIYNQPTALTGNPLPYVGSASIRSWPDDAPTSKHRQTFLDVYDLPGDAPASCRLLVKNTTSSQQLGPVRIGAQFGGDPGKIIHGLRASLTAAVGGIGGSYGSGDNPDMVIPLGTFAVPLLYMPASALFPWPKEQHGSFKLFTGGHQNEAAIAVIVSGMLDAELATILLSGDPQTDATGVTTNHHVWDGGIFSWPPATAYSHIRDGQASGALRTPAGVIRPALCIAGQSAESTTSDVAYIWLLPIDGGSFTFQPFGSDADAALQENEVLAIDTIDEDAASVGYLIREFDQADGVVWLAVLSGAGLSMHGTGFFIPPGEPGHFAFLLARQGVAADYVFGRVYEEDTIEVVLEYMPRFLYV